MKPATALRFVLAPMRTVSGPSPSLLLVVMLLLLLL
jgi:hypothetical protein